MPKPAPIPTLHGAEYAALLIEARIRFYVTYVHPPQVSFHVDDDDESPALKLLMKLRGSKLR
jgi:hypothetical protein